MEELKKKTIRFKVNLITQKDVIELSQIANICPRNISVYAKHDTYIIDAKSLLSLFGLDLSNEIEIEITNVYGNEEFLNGFNKWRVND